MAKIWWRCASSFWDWCRRSRWRFGNDSFAQGAPPDGLSPSSKLIIGTLELISTFGFFLDDHRNSKLHDDLMSRGRKIEDKLGIDIGIVRGRLKSFSIVQHDQAMNVIDGSSVFAWVAALVMVALER
jgi:hypothetical protein